MMPLTARQVSPCGLCCPHSGQVMQISNSLPFYKELAPWCSLLSSPSSTHRPLSAHCLSPLSARVGPSVPRQDRPVREGTRVASIETGLAAAAAKLSQQVRERERLPGECQELSGAVRSCQQ